MQAITSFFETKINLPDLWSLPFDFSMLTESVDWLKIGTLWLIILFMVLEIRALWKKCPAAPLAPVYLSYKKAGNNGKDSVYKNRPIRKISTRVGSNIFFKDIPLLGSKEAFCFDIIYENGIYMIHEKGYEPMKISLNTQFRRGDYYFILKELII